MHSAQLKSTVDSDHKSDIFENISLATAKTEAKNNYVSKYPHDNLADTVYVTT
ncbi:MAG: hypothetical protein JXQ93_00210 [Flavobacteriaceae bacterium]